MQQSWKSSRIIKSTLLYHPFHCSPSFLVPRLLYATEAPSVGGKIGSERKTASTDGKAGAIEAQSNCNSSEFIKIVSIFVFVLPQKAKYGNIFLLHLHFIRGKWMKHLVRLFPSVSVWHTVRQVSIREERRGGGGRRRREEPGEYFPSELKTAGIHLNCLTNERDLMTFAVNILQKISAVLNALWYSILGLRTDQVSV